MSNDVFPKSALPSPILDRFRQLLKQREDQIRVSGNGFDDVAITTEEFVRIYEDVLSELTINSKPIITDLTIIAGDFSQHAEGIAQLICSRVLEVPVEQKMPSLYLLDSIVKNIGRDYVGYFASRLPKVFCEVYKQVPSSMHSSMDRLFGTWSSVFPSSVLRQVEDELQLSSCVNQPSSRVASLRASESPRPSRGIHDTQLERRVPNLKAYKGYENFDYDQDGDSDTQRSYTTATGIGSRVSFSPSAIGSGRPLSPSVDDFAVTNSPGRMFGKEPFHYGRSRVRGRDEEIVGWPKRPRLGDFNRSHDDVASCSSNNGFKRDSPSALIDAYGRDNGQRSLNKKPIGRGLPIGNGAVTKIAENSWQNTEEEEFDWQDMSPTLADRKTSNVTQSSISISGRERTSELNVNGAPRDGNSFRVSMSSPFPPGPPGLQQQTTVNCVIPSPSLYLLQEQPRPSFGCVNSSFTILNQVPPQQPQSRFGPIHHQPRQPVSLPQQTADLGYPQHGQMTAPINIRNNAIPVYHTPPSFLNTSTSLMQFQGPVPPFVPIARPNSHILPLPPNSGSIANHPAPVNISGLLSSGLLDSLVANRLLPLMKQSSEKDFIGVEFHPDFLKVRHESVIRALYEDLPRQCTTCGLRFKTQDEHSKHMDWHVTKNRMSKNRKHNNPSRKWFVSVSMWLSGAEALGVVAAPGFLPSESNVENKDDVEMAVPADEDQTTCALCWEPFEDYYSDETEEWMYRGAVYLNAPSSGTAVGIDRSQLGPIVHAKCRSESAAVPT